MASLIDMAKEKGLLDEDKGSHEKSKKEPTNKPRYGKRRPWLEEESLDNTTEKPSTKSVQNLHKTGTKSVQNLHKTGTKVVQNLHKTGTKVIQNLHKTGTKVVQKTGTKVVQKKGNLHKSGTQTYTNIDTKVVQNLHKSGTKVVQNKTKVSCSFFELVGLQKSLCLIIYERCIFQRSKSTGPITLETLSHRVNTTKGSTKRALQILQEKGFIRTINFKNGRGGWCDYLLNEGVFQEVLNSESGTKVVQNLHKSGTKPTHKPTHKPTQTAPSSSSSLSNKKTTTTVDLENENWQTVQTPENLRRSGFGKTHVDQIRSRTELTPMDLQESLDSFSYDLSEGHITARVGVLNLFMGIITKKGKYVSEKLLETQNIELNEYINKLDQFEKNKEMMAKVEKEKEFEIWMDSLNQDEKDRLVPESKYVKSGSPFQKTQLRQHWEKNNFEIEL